MLLLLLLLFFFRMFLLLLGLFFMLLSGLKLERVLLFKVWWQDFLLFFRMGLNFHLWMNYFCYLDWFCYTSDLFQSFRLFKFANPWRSDLLWTYCFRIYLWTFAFGMVRAIPGLNFRGSCFSQRIYRMLSAFGFSFFFFLFFFLLFYLFRRWSVGIVLCDLLVALDILLDDLD